MVGLVDQGAKGDRLALLVLEDEIDGRALAQLFVDATSSAEKGRGAEAGALAGSA